MSIGSRATTTLLRNIINNIREKPLKKSTIAKNVSISSHSRRFLDGLTFLTSTGLIVKFKQTGTDCNYYKLNR